MTSKQKISSIQKQPSKYVCLKVIHIVLLISTLSAIRAKIGRFIFNYNNYFRVHIMIIEIPPFKNLLWPFDTESRLVYRECTVPERKQKRKKNKQCAN